MHDAVTIACRSPALDAAACEAVVTLPTFRRPEHLLKTLDSLREQATARRFAVIVMENDAETLAGLGAARPMFEDGRLAGLIVVARERGNCSAYNAGWSTAVEHFPGMRHLLVIDDDEMAPPDWLERLVLMREQLGVDIVGAPQVPVFEGPGQRYRRHPVFKPHYAATGRVPILYSSGNVVIGRNVLEAMERPYLDTSFNFIGGGDSDFYARCRARGFSFGWCAEAPVAETTPARRTEFSWLNARGLRNGAISSIIERRLSPGPAARLKRLGKSAALLAASPVRSARLALDTRSAVIGLYHMQVAAGRLLAELGLVNEQYRRPERN